MDTYDIARWLTEGGDLGASDEEFAETFVLMQKMWENPAETDFLQLDGNDMRNADTEAIAENIKSRLEKVLSNGEDLSVSKWWESDHCQLEYDYNRDESVLADISLNDAAQWLGGGSVPELSAAEKDGLDVRFAETLVLMYKMQNNWDNRENETLNSTDMQNADPDAITGFIRGCLDEIIYSEEIDASAWWKQNSEEDIEL